MNLLHAFEDLQTITQKRTAVIEILEDRIETYGALVELQKAEIKTYIRELEALQTQIERLLYEI